VPTPPLSNEKMQEAIDAASIYGSQKDAAQAIGIPHGTFRNRYQAAKRAGLHLSSGAQKAMNNAGLNGVEAKGGWIHNYDSETGNKTGTTRWTAPVETSEDVLGRMREAFEGMTPLAPVLRPEGTVADLCNVLPLFDVHWGMAAWGEETGGQDYNLTLARDDLMRGMEKVLSRAAHADTCVLLLGGDFLHADDDKAQTPGSKHPLDVSARMYKALDTGIAIIKYAVTRALEHHDRVLVRVLRGNHDPNSHRAIAFALREWLANNDRARIDMTPAELFQFQWGRTAIFGQHGDRMTPTMLALKLADVCPFWTECRHRHAYTGHKHNLAAARIGGLNWQRLEPFAPTDDYGSSWVNRRGMKLDTYDKRDGWVGGAGDPLERD
jgi:hypothetical protein